MLPRTAYIGGVGRSRVRLIAHAKAHPHPEQPDTCEDHGPDASELAPTLRAMTGPTPTPAGRSRWHSGEWCKPIQSNPFNNGDAGTEVTMPVLHGWAVRRLTQVECERLQRFPHGYTAVPWWGGIIPNGPRYGMLGNSMAVNLMRWIRRRTEAIDALPGGSSP